MTVKINPLDVRTKGTYIIKAVRTNNDGICSVAVKHIEEWGEYDGRSTYVGIMEDGGALEEIFTFVLDEDGYGLEIESTATCTMYACADAKSDLIGVYEINVLTPDGNFKYYNKCLCDNCKEGFTTNLSESLKAMGFTCPEELE